MKKNVILICMLITACLLMAGCGKKNISDDNAVAEAPQAAVLEDGTYLVDFDTDGSMFHVNEACEGKGTLTVKDGEMMLHISLPSKNVVNLFPGLAEDAKKDGAVLLEPTIDTVTYNDGMTEEVHGFDIPITVIGEEFDLALLGTKGKWYDHKVIVSNPERKETADDGEYTVNVTLEGGTGKATITSPATVLVKDGKYYVRIEWSSPHYDYMKLAGETYYPVNTDGNSVFELPINSSDKELSVIADTTAMGTPHEIEYSIIFDFDSMKKVGEGELIYDHALELDYATEFSVDYYDGGYAMISVSDGSCFFVVPENIAVPKKLPRDAVVIRKPIKNIYLVASAVMDMFVSMDALDFIALSGTKAEGWYLDEAREAMESGSILYAGKYSMPDYERIVDTECSLAIESTMILHSPEVQENLEALGIPVLVDRSSYESHPLGRTEWIKLYGVLIGKEAEAEAAFEIQKNAFETIANEESTGKTVAFFFITSNGMVSVRKSADYVPKMIELAGGMYVFSDLGDDTASSSVNMTLEEFYAAAKDADFLIYNSTISGEIDSLNALVDKHPVFSDFKAVKEGNVFCTTQNFYQESMETGSFITDIFLMLHEEENADASFRYLYRL